MKKITYILKIASLLSVVCLYLAGCKKDEIKSFDGSRALFFMQRNPNDSKIITDSIYVSFSDYFEVTEIKIPFTVSLIGSILASDTEYAVSIIKEATNANPANYILLEKYIFRKGMSQDTLWITVKKEGLTEKDMTLKLRITENEHFINGYYNRQIATLVFNNAIVRPTWWTEDIRDIYFGEWSYEKIKTITYAAAEVGIKFTSTENMEPTTIRYIAVITRDYILKNGITEENGDEMIMVAY